VIAGATNATAAINNTRDTINSVFTRLSNAGTHLYWQQPHFSRRMLAAALLP
jgi:hypothetical protein